MQRRGRLQLPALALVSSALLVLSLVPLASGTAQVSPGRPGFLVFQRRDDSNTELYRASLTGDDVRKLLSRPGTNESHPNWSPSGKQLVFTTGPLDSSDFDLWLVNANGTGARPLVTGPTKDLWGQFCGDRVVFTRQLSTMNYDLWSIGLGSGEKPRRLTHDPGAELYASCHPSGDRIAFNSSRGGQNRIWGMRLDGTGQTLLTRRQAIDAEYLANGALAYVAQSGGTLNVFRQGPGATKAIQLTFAKMPLQYRLPKGSPDGKAVYATLYDLTKKSELVQRIAPGKAITIVENGSAGTVQPRPAGARR